MKYVLLVLLLIAGGCSTPPTRSTYRPAGSTEAPWRVAGVRTSFGDRIDVTINDSVVCTLDMGIMGNSDEAKAEYRGHKVHCTLQKTTGWTGDGMVCIVMIDGELAGKFEWKD